MPRSIQSTVTTSNSVQVALGPCFLHGVTIDETNPAGRTYYIWDNTSTAAPIVLKLVNKSPGSLSVRFNCPIAFRKGIYLSASGSTHTATFLVS